jgi:hypothetical protein
MWLIKDIRTPEEKTLDYLKKHEKDFIRAILYIPEYPILKCIIILLEAIWMFLALAAVALWG